MTGWDVVRLWITVVGAGFLYARIRRWFREK